MKDIFEYLKHNSYPGRGLIIGRSEDRPVIAYFIMGRSENSRNRVFRKREDTVYTKAYDESKVKDPSLIIYNAVRGCENMTIVTNGDQTDTVYEYLKQGSTFRDALDTREYEPDGPNYTPRISGLLHEDGSYEIAILKREGEACRRDYYLYPAENGKGHFISTYDHDGDPLPSFSGEPIAIPIGDDPKRFAMDLWESLDRNNRISLYVRFGSMERIFNKHGGAGNE
jgi:IMP cyclohydrolase